MDIGTYHSLYAYKITLVVQKLWQYKVVNLKLLLFFFFALSSSILVTIIENGPKKIHRMFCNKTSDSICFPKDVVTNQRQFMFFFLNGFR